MTQDVSYSHLEVDHKDHMKETVLQPGQPDDGVQPRFARHTHQKAAPRICWLPRKTFWLVVVVGSRLIGNCRRHRWCGRRGGSEEGEE